MSKSVFALLGLGIAAALAGISQPAAAQVSQVKFGCTGSASSHYVYCTTIAREIAKRSAGQNWTVIASGGVRDNFDLLNKGEIKIGVGAPDALLQFEARKPPYQDSGNNNYRLLWIFTIAPQNIVVRADSGINALTDLNGKNFIAGARGTVTEVVFKDMLTTLGITPNYESGSYEDAAAAMQDRRVVGFGKASPGLYPDAVFLRLQTSIKIRALPFPPEAVTKIRAGTPENLFGEIPANTVMPDQPAFTTWVVPLSIIAHKDYPEQQAYEAVKAAMEARNDIFKVYPGILEDQAKATIQYNLGKMHPGAIRYFEEKGLKVPPEQKG